MCNYLYIYIYIFLGSITSVNKDTLYAVCWYDSNEWCRAIVLNELENSLVLVKYPDYGNEEIINRSDLHVLPHPFYSLPFQVNYFIYKHPHVM